MARYRDYDCLLPYCQRSANPVGRLMLGLCGYSDERRQMLSDATCTGLQLANTRTALPMFRCRYQLKSTGEAIYGYHADTGK